MSKNILQIDASSLKDKKAEDSIKIRLKNDDDIQLNFANFFIQSKYLLDKYKYYEALDSIQSEIDEFQQKYNISDESIKYFIEFIEESKVKLPIEHYKDIYTLCEYFCIPQFTKILDKISKEELFNDLNFTIQTLQELLTSNDNVESKMISKIENFLKERINECIKNSKFSELPVPTIYRIVDQSKENIDQNLFIDFILDSADNRFILFKFVELQKLNNYKFNEFIKFICEQDESSKKKYLEYIPFNLSFIVDMKNKYNQILNEFDQTKQELNQTKQELDQTKQRFNQTKQELDQTKQRFNQTKQDLNQTKQELNQTKQNYEQTKQELNQTKQELDQTKQRFNQTKQELNQIKQNYEQTKQELNQTKQESDQIKRDLYGCNIELKQAKNEKKQYKQFIIIGGNDFYNQLGLKPNNKAKNRNPVIHPPILRSFDLSSLRSYSICWCHSVLVMSDGLLKGIGCNNNGQISSTLQKKTVDDFTDFLIKDSSGHQLAAISAVCCKYNTLYMFSKSSSNERQLVLCDCDINNGEPVFLDIGNHHPVSLFGGCSHSAAICSEGEVIFINRDSFKNSPNSPIEAVSLPEGEKASSVACCNNIVIALSSNGRAFESPVDSNRILKFSSVPELSNQEIVYLSGTSMHCLAVSKEGRVFGRGSNEYGKLGFEEGTKSVSSFTEISSLFGYEIRAAYAGSGHSLFETREGKILSCGSNSCGELLLNNDLGQNVYSPTETTITSGATFCIAGNCTSMVFFSNSPQPNAPNMRIQQYK